MKTHDEEIKKREEVSELVRRLEAEIRNRSAAQHELAATRTALGLETNRVDQALRERDEANMRNVRMERELIVFRAKVEAFELALRAVGPR